MSDLSPFWQASIAERGANARYAQPSDANMAAFRSAPPAQVPLALQPQAQVPLATLPEPSTVPQMVYPPQRPNPLFGSIDPYYRRP